jgi:SAM-dependent methyltransferase
MTEERVKAANRQLYDAIGDRYEEIDGRRSPVLELWLREIMTDLRRKASGGRLLDIGSGSGLVARCAEGLFDLRVGMDISPKILSANSHVMDAAIAADLDSLPFADESFDVVSCFAVLHHLYSFEGLVSQVSRVLKEGGVFYSDHDMDRSFYSRFSVPLRIYKKLRGAKKKYQEASEIITEELYDNAEWQENGIDSWAFIRAFEAEGFSVETKFHWYGLAGITDRLFGARSFNQGLAPLLSIQAIKGHKG